MLKRLIWFWQADRLGPDMLTTHPLLYFKKTSEWLCKKKFNAFGEGSEFRPHAFAISTSNIFIGKNVLIRPGTMLFADDTQSGQIFIEDDVEIGASVHFYVNNHDYRRIDIPIKYQGYFESKPIRVCCGAWIGACSVILPGVTIGRNAVVGAGSIVTRDVDPYTIAVGNPARKIKDIS
jgi:acetyltransferase-like isoleucine patch superfamily enzyme